MTAHHDESGTRNAGRSTLSRAIEWASRAGVAVEMATLAWPSSLLGVYAAAFAPQFGLEDAEPPWTGGVALLLLTLVVPAALFAGWVLATVFVFAGRAALRRTHAGWWWTVGVGAALVVVGWSWPYDRPAELGLVVMFRTAWPLFVPLAHLALERGWDPPPAVAERVAA